MYSRKDIVNLIAAFLQAQPSYQGYWPTADKLLSLLEQLGFDDHMFEDDTEDNVEDFV